MSVSFENFVDARSPPNVGHSTICARATPSGTSVAARAATNASGAERRAANRMETRLVWRRRLILHRDSALGQTALDLVRRAQRERAECKRRVGAAAAHGRRRADDEQVLVIVRSSPRVDDARRPHPCPCGSRPPGDPGKLSTFVRSTFPFPARAISLNSVRIDSSVGAALGHGLRRVLKRELRQRIAPAILLARSRASARSSGRE